MLLVESRFNDLTTESLDSPQGKKLYLKGIFAESERQNRNGRTYDLKELTEQVNLLRDKIASGHDVLGELDHPESLNISLKNVSHRITDIHMEGNNAVGKAEIIPTAVGNIAKALLEAGVRIGISTRGHGNVNEGNGRVSDYHLITMDLVASPSAIEAYPTPVLESLDRYHRGQILNDMAFAASYDKKAQRFFAEEMTKFIQSLGK